MIDFPTFFGAARAGDAGERPEPYPWQTALAERLAGGEPPRAIVVPTGCGKTTTIDALVWALAMQADRRPHERTIGVRTVWAIDRRILVDEVYAHVTRLAARLATAVDDEADPLHPLARRLASYTRGIGPPLAVDRWRGQVRIEPRAHHPLQPQVITSTVAQIGSRLLFRGYGVGERSRAIEAALSAVDSTICLDEAHLAEPFRRTVDGVRALRAAGEPPGTFGPLTLLTLSATPAGPTDASNVHGLSADDEPHLARRLDAPKTAVLVETSSDRDGDQVTAILDAIDVHLEDGARRLACVVNTVRFAVLVAEATARRFEDSLDRVMLVGPQRPFDRVQALARHRDTIFARANPPRPLLVIATQAIEVGLDADFEALVTQSASATALVQRFGRLNRGGCDAGRATIVRHRGSALYADDEEACWDWLERHRGPGGLVDISPRAIAADGGPPADRRAPLTPVLTAVTVELLQQTAPRPALMADPPIEPFLRGVDELPADDVLVCWREDLRLERDDDVGRAYRQALLVLAPPQPEELVPLGLRRFHAFLAARFGDPTRRAAVARAAQADADVEGGADEQSVAEDLGSGRAVMGFLVLRDGEVLEVASGSETRQRDVRPGDVIVLDASAGGYADGALAPASAARVPDIGNEVAAQLTGDRWVAVRLSPDTMAATRGDRGDALGRARKFADEGGVANRFEARALLEAVGITSEFNRLDVRRVAGRGRAEVADVWDEDEEDAETNGASDRLLLEDERSSEFECFVLLAPNRRPDLVRTAAQAPPALEAHALSVADRAAEFAITLDDRLKAAVTLAARAHDHGKGDDRIQAFFRGGALSPGDDLLAKSVFGTDDRRAARLAGDRAGLPRGLRHEIASVAILADHLAQERPPHGWELDEDLALHLVGVHHGLGRPWPKMPRGGSPARPFAVEQAGIHGVGRGDGLDGWADGAWLHRFFAVTSRYGAWGTAYLEAFLVLADRTVSADGG